MYTIIDTVLNVPVTAYKYKLKAIVIAEKLKKAFGKKYDNRIEVAHWYDLKN